MRPSTVCIVTFAVSLYFGVIPAFPQSLGTPVTLGQERERSGKDGSQGQALKSTGIVSGKATASDRLTQNTKLSAKLQELLSSGTNLQDAAEGFGQLAEFVSAVYVSYNLGIPFDELKEKIMSGKELGPAIRELRPDINSRQAIIKANSQARDLLEKSTTSNINLPDAEGARSEY
ncbi:MAG: hypothetical protein E6J89_12550 [Deltaproteobacteria bacterium]|nr:MAG: hypothetical protein E6J89_12550 [Deltaproteobacteria bacterium]